MMFARTERLLLRPGWAEDAPALAQAPSEQPSTRAGVLDQAREALTSQSVPPERSTIERGLYWYDNQYVINKIFGGWKGIRLGGGDFPAGAGMKFGVIKVNW